MTEWRIDPAAIKGRGAVSKLAHRFSIEDRSAVDDGWAPEVDETSSPPVTTITWEMAKSAISRNDSPDIHFEQAVNPYRGCEHGCIYCFARPTHSYLNLSPGLDFESRLIAKRNIVPLLREEIGRRNYVPKLIVLGTATDAYQPVEREHGLTRGILELMRETRHPVSLVTKSSGVERDLDILSDLAKDGLVSVYVSIATLDGPLARRMEPRAVAPHRRLRTLRALAEAGVPCGVSLAPQIPFLNEDMEHVMEAAREAGASRAFYHVLRLPWEVAPLFKEWLHAHYPDRAARVMGRLQEMRGGRDYDADFATRMKGAGIWAELIRQRFEKAVRRFGFETPRVVPDVSRFRPPADRNQPSLF